MKKIELHSEQDTIDLANYLAPLLKPGDILTLSGDLGSGKTFFAKQLGKQRSTAPPLCFSRNIIVAGFRFTTSISTG